MTRASLLFVRLGVLIIEEMLGRFGRESFRIDPVHILVAIATSIAFLGAGTIFRDPEAEKMRGLTTAASLLVVGSIGIAVAVDRYVVAVGVTLLTVFVLRNMEFLEKPWHHLRSKSRKGCHPTHPDQKA